MGLFTLHNFCVTCLWITGSICNKIKCERDSQRLPFVVFVCVKIIRYPWFFILTNYNWFIYKKALQIYWAGTKKEFYRIVINRDDILSSYAVYLTFNSLKDVIVWIGCNKVVKSVLKYVRSTESDKPIF